MMMSYAENTNAQQKATNKKHLEPERRIEFRSGATTSNPLDFNRPYSRIAGYLYKPKGEGRHPAVALLHGVKGIHRIHVEWAKRLAAWGYVALLVDSRERLDPGPKRSPMVMAQDAYGALKYLHSLTFVDSERIAVMGWYYGASAIISALKANPQQPSSPPSLFTNEPNYRFRAGVAYHPRCSSVVMTLYAPLLVLVGDKNEYFLRGGCDTFPKENRAGGQPYRITMYPDATFLFDYGENMQDAWLNRYIPPDPSVTNDSIKRVRAFLKENL
jgi:dienelactone hydrolase